MKQVPVRYKGRLKYAVVDDDDYPLVRHKKWFLSDGRKRVYCSLSSGGTTSMGRLLLGLEPRDPRRVDHKDRDPLNNRRSNIRIVPNDASNNQNLSPRGTVPFRGVVRRAPRRYEARVQVNGERLRLGYFATPERAARAAADVRRLVMKYSEEASR